MSGVRKPFVLAITGTSLGTGYLAADWVPKLACELRGYPEAIGPVRILNMGHGGWTSADILNNAPNLSALQPTHILFEGGGINSSAVSGGVPAVTRSQHILNIQAMVAQWRAAIPGVDLTLQTMSPVSAVGTALRPNLSDYYADELATATTLGLRTINNFAGWPNPIARNLTHLSNPFRAPLTNGFAAGPDDMGWGSATGATIAADKQSATATTSGTVYLMGDTGFTTPTHFEITAGGTATGGVYPSIGAGLASAYGSGADPGLGNDAIVARRDGTIFYNGATVGNLGAPIFQNDCIAVEVDPANKLVYFQKIGQARTAGFPVAGMAGPYYPIIKTSGELNDVIAARFWQNGDGLHPIWSGAVDTYLYPNVLAWARARMAEFWAA